MKKNYLCQADYLLKITAQTKKAFVNVTKEMIFKKKTLFNVVAATEENMSASHGSVGVLYMVIMAVQTV